MDWGRGILTVCRFIGMLPMYWEGVSSECLGLEVCYQWTRKGYPQSV